MAASSKPSWFCALLRFPVATPADWNVGDKVIVRTNLTTDDARAQFGDQEVVVPYPRKTSLPG